MKTKTFSLQINYRLVPTKYNGGEGYKNGYSCEIDEQLTQQADLYLGQGKWYATHFQALEKENGDLVFKMKAVKAKVKNHA